MKKLNKLIILLGVVLCSFTVLGCGAKEQKAPAAAQAAIEIPYTEALKQYGITGKTVLAKKPERIICLANTPVLTLHKLGLKLVGIPQSKVMQWPRELEKNVKLFEVGMKNNIDIESVIAEKPDLVFVGYHAKDTYGKILERENIPVYYVDAGPTVSYESVKELNMVLIEALGKDTLGAKDIQASFAALEKRLEEQKAKNKHKRVLILQAAPPRYFTQNQNGTVGSMANLLGFTNVSASSGGTMVMLDQEKALSYNPDVVICTGAMATAAEQQALMEAAFAKQKEYWYQIKAIRDKKVVYLPRTYAVSGGLNVIDNINGLIDALAQVENGKK